MKVIALSREFGAGGHSIGRKVANSLGIEFYDKDIIRKVSEESGVDSALIEREGEEISRIDSFFRSISPIAYDQKDAIFNAEKEVIIELAKKGPCVILGRCADVILREAGIDCVNVFLYASEEDRRKRVGEIISSDNAAEIQKVMKRTDHNRHSYYSYYTDKAWGDYRNYNLMLDSGMLGYDTCVDIIVAAAKAAK